MTPSRPQPHYLGIAANRCYRLLLAVSVVCGLTATPGRAQELRYEVELKTTATSQTLAVEVTGLGFTRRDSLVAYLADWGDWTELGHPYLQHVIVRGRPVAPVAGMIPLGTGPFVLRYELPVLDDTSTDSHRLSLLPRGGPGTAVAAVRNTLVEIRRGGERVAARESIRLAAPKIGGTFTGWAGFAAGSQSAPVLPVGETENGFYAFGVSQPVIRVADGFRIEVTSADADGSQRVSDVADLASRTLPILEKLTGVKPDTVVRLIVQGSGLPGVTRGTTTQFGIAVALPPGDVWDESTQANVVHELTHLWIGRRFPGESLIWFMEGFTDYLSLWASTAAGVVSPDWFARRLAAIADEVAALPPSLPGPLTAPGAVGRDDDGPAERLGYRGGALVAFGLDVALRASNKGTLGGFVGRLLARPDSVLGERAIHSTAEALGAAAEFDATVGSPPMVSPWAPLRSIGYVITEEAASLVALGIAADAVGRPTHLTMGPVVVRAVDPQGPSAAADIVPGDIVIIHSDRRSNPPTHDAAITAVTLGKYAFGSSVVPSGARTVTLEVRRNGETRTVAVTPRLVQGGVRLSATWETSNGSSFFKQ
jgi:hypothetical protein